MSCWSWSLGNTQSQLPRSSMQLLKYVVFYLFILNGALDFDDIYLCDWYYCCFEVDPRSCLQGQSRYVKNCFGYTLWMEAWFLIILIQRIDSNEILQDQRSRSNRQSSRVKLVSPINYKQKIGFYWISLIFTSRFEACEMLKSRSQGQ